MIEDIEQIKREAREEVQAERRECARLSDERGALMAENERLKKRLDEVAQLLLAEQTASAPSEDYRGAAPVPRPSEGVRWLFAHGVPEIDIPQPASESTARWQDMTPYKPLTGESAPDRLVYSNAPYRVAYADPQPVAVWEPTPALGKPTLGWIWKAYGEQDSPSGWDAWVKCADWLWDYLHSQPPEPEDPCEAAYKAWFKKEWPTWDGNPLGAVQWEPFRAAWVARGEQPS